MTDDLVKLLRGEGDAHFRGVVRDRRTIGSILTQAADRIEELEAKLAKAVEALEGVRAFVRDLAPYADQGHALVPALEKACTTLAELTGGKDD